MTLAFFGIVGVLSAVLAILWVVKGTLVSWRVGANSSSHAHADAMLSAATSAAVPNEATIAQLTKERNNAEWWFWLWSGISGGIKVTQDSLWKVPGVIRRFKAKSLGYLWCLGDAATVWALCQYQVMPENWRNHVSAVLSVVGRHV